MSAWSQHGVRGHTLSYLRLLVCRGVQASSPILSRSMAVHCCIMRVTPLACSTWLPALPGCCSELPPK